MKFLGRVSLAAVVVAFGEIMLGSWTRINGAGMTCPDYPLCRGRFVPSLAGGTLWEWTHRVTAALLSLLVLALLATAWRLRKRSPFIGPAAWVVGALFSLQVFLGAATVHLANTPVSVVWHWGTAMAFIASLACMAIFAYAPDTKATAQGRSTPSIFAPLAITAFIAFLTMCVGAYVSSSGAGLACRDIPQCAGNVVVYTPGQYVQMLHRLVALACLISAVVSFALAWVSKAPSRVRIVVTLGTLFVFVQVLLGLMNVAFALPIDLREAHAANAALVFLTFVCASALSLPALARRWATS